MNATASPATANSQSASPELHIRPLTRVDEIESAEQLLARVFGATEAGAPLPGDVIAAFAHWGGCVLGAYVDDQLVGTSVAVVCGPHSGTLASLVAGVLPDAAGIGVGRKLKLAQRDWARERGVEQIVWTFDPLVRRNAHFNLTRLGARVTEYTPEHYPPIRDGINDGDLTDRLHVSWAINADPSPASLPTQADQFAQAASVLSIDPATGGPVLTLPPATQPDGRSEPNVAEQQLWRVATPDDIEALRRTDPDVARQWRLAMRAVFLAPGQRQVIGFSRAGEYLLCPAPQTTHQCDPQATGTPTATLITTPSGRPSVEMARQRHDHQPDQEVPHE